MMASWPAANRYNVANRYDGAFASSARPLLRPQSLPFTPTARRRQRGPSALAGRAAGIMPPSVQPSVSQAQLNIEAKTEERARWGNPIEFTISCIGYAVGLGNFWRFPYYCYQYGGGAFLVPYTLVLLIIGVPLFLLELYVGQKHQVSAAHAWAQIHPAFGGLGLAGVVATFFVALYYNVIVAWGARTSSCALVCTPARSRPPHALAPAARLSCKKRSPVSVRLQHCGSSSTRSSRRCLGRTRRI